MTSSTRPGRLITGKSIREYFQDSVTAALANQSIETRADTAYYLVNLLTHFARTDRLYERTPDGMMVRPLALLYKEAVEGATPAERHRALQRLGDLALFVAGVFADSLRCKPVDVDYYVSMGGSAYGYLSRVGAGHHASGAWAEVFEELAARFVDFVDVLAEVSERTHLARDTDVLRLYEVWVRTGSRRAARRLREAGIEPSAGSVSRSQH